MSENVPQIQPVKISNKNTGSVNSKPVFSFL